MIYLLHHLVMAEYHWHQGNARYRKKLYSTAIHQYTLALQYGLPGFVININVLYCDRADAYYLDGRTPETVADYDKALRRSPQMARYHCEKAVGLRYHKRYKEAVAAMDRAIALPSPRPGYYYERALSLMALDDYPRAVADLNQ